MLLRPLISPLSAATSGDGMAVEPELGLERIFQSSPLYNQPPLKINVLFLIIGQLQVLTVTFRMSCAVGNEAARDGPKHSAAFILRAAIAAAVPTAGPVSWTCRVLFKAP